jgi:alpha,alpha-trehalase
MPFIMKPLCFVFALFWTTTILSQLTPTPDSLYGPLFHEVQFQRVFRDGKTFVDCIPKRPVEEIMYDYGLQKGPNLDLKKFVSDNFEIAEAPPLPAASREKDVLKHIKALWSVLKRPADAPLPPGGPAASVSLLPLPYPYIVPGGRFREIYYWDSYFTMLGLKESGEIEMMENMVRNFAHLISSYGHIPNGNRNYYLSRSQPPFFSLMVELLASVKGNDVYKTYLPAMQQEYLYWMQGENELEPGQAEGTVYKFDNGDVLNRYWDEAKTARPESYREDHETADSMAAQLMSRMKFSSKSAEADMRSQLREEAFIHLRAGAASGWDFSSRWFEDEQNITTIETAKILPVDLNCLIYHLEATLAKAFQQTGNQAKATGFFKAAAKRAFLINKYFWNTGEGFYTDYHWENQSKQSGITAAGVFPLCLLPRDSVVSKADRISVVIETELLRDGGILTTRNFTGQQWDAPNGWAPLQWMAAWGLDRCNKTELARDIATRWVKLNASVFARTGKMMEKYNVENTALEAGGGEYETQDGFGWTNGVFLAMVKKFNIAY